MYQPIQQNKRIELIDAIRGFALLGILMVNMPLMYEPISKMMIDSEEDTSLSYLLSESFIKFFFEGKFFLFSLHFLVMVFTFSCRKSEIQKIQSSLFLEEDYFFF